jgi:hypothetical protein
MIVGRTEEFEVSRLPQPLNDASEMKLQLTRAADALAELYDLLEEYAPTWYTQQHHERAESALRLLNKR